MTKRRGGSEFLRDQTADAAVSMHQALAGSMWVAVCPEPPDVVDLSERLAAALGYTLDQLRAAPLEEFLWSPQPDTFASGGSSEAVFKRKDGRLLWVALSWIDAGPNRVAIATDVTDLKLTAATAGVASDIRAAAVSAESDAEVAQRAAEALVRRGLCRGAAVFLARPESRAWRLAGISVAGRRGERGASSIPCPVEVAAAEHDPWSVSAESVAMPRSIKLPPHLAEVLNLPLESKAAVIPALGSKGIAGLIVSVPPEPILSAAAQIGEVGRALAESIAAVLQRMADRALIAAAERQRLLANQGMRAVHALRRGARGLAAARSEEAALSVVLDCIASVVAVDWAGWARKERTGSPAVLLAAWPHSQSIPFGPGSVIPRHDPAIAEALDRGLPATGETVPAATSFQQALSRAGLGHWAAVPIQTLGGGVRILIAARRYEHGAAFREDEVALLQAAASLLSLGLDKPVGGTALIAAEPRVEEWIIQAERLRAAMDVARGVAHYLGNKLGVLVAKIERTAAASRDKAVREGLRAALDVADEVGECLRKLQVISWRPAEQLAGRVDLSEVVSRATDLVLEKRRSWLGSNADQFHVDIQVCEQVEAEGNFDRLVDAFAAILDNALDAMPQGGKVEVSIGAAGCWAWVRLIDTGIGFPQHFGERVFAPFFSTKGPSAMGLGLTLAWAVVAKHGGHMLICSQLQKGTAVAVYLPRSFDQER